jgi:Fe-S cluster assembly ATPase SufC
VTINPKGHMIGIFFGPNTQGVVMTDGCILGQNRYELETGKSLFKKVASATMMSSV